MTNDTINKTGLVDLIVSQNECSKVEAERAINLTISGIIGAITEGHNVNLIGFGNFTINPTAARAGINPKTKEPIQVAAHNQVRFRVGQKLKDAANNAKGDNAKKDKAKDAKSKK